MQNSWYVLTGGPATGKTTLLNALGNLGYVTIQEAAREHIDHSYKKGIPVEELRRNERQFQEDVARIKERYESTLNPHETVFFDRGMHDTVAYMDYYGYPLDDWLKKLIAASSYKKVFLLDEIKVDRKDYARTEDDTFMDQINDLLFKAYADNGMTPVMVPPGSVKNRADFILSQL